MIRIGVDRIGVERPGEVRRSAHVPDDWCPVCRERCIFIRTALVCPRCRRLVGGF